MKIVQLVTRNCNGGVQVVARNLDKGLSAAGHASSVWFYCGTEEEQHDHARVVSLFRRRPSWLYYPRLLVRLYKLLRRERPDVLIAHTTHAAVPGLLLAMLAGTRKRIAVQHNALNTYSRLARAADRFCANRHVFWRNVAVAKGVQETMVAYSEDALGRVRLILNGIQPEPVAERVRAGLESSEAVLVLSVGRLVEQKNQRVLVEAMHRVEQAMLVIVGGGELQEALQVQVRDGGLSSRVRLTGALRHVEVKELMRSAEIFVSASSFEAMPMAVLEAMQAGLAIVASDIVAHRELLGEAGLLVEGAAAGIAEGIHRFLADAGLRERLGHAARERVELFSEAAMVQGYLDVIAEAQ